MAKLKALVFDRNLNMKNSLSLLEKKIVFDNTAKIFCYFSTMTRLRTL